MLRRTLLILFAKAARSLVRLKGGHGSALPGLIVEKFDDNFLPAILNQLPQGVIVVTGTNGKTTTTRMIVHLLRAQGLSVITNHSGSNLNRGLISTLIEHCSITGRLEGDLAVFELDEAYARHFTKKVAPKLLVALNVMRDQLDRYGEIDITASYIAEAAEKAGMVLVNGNDTLLCSKITAVNKNTKKFGLSTQLQRQLASEATLYGKAQTVKSNQRELEARVTEVSSADTSQHIVFDIQGTKVQADIALLGIHNALNVCVAIFTANLVTGQKLTALVRNLKDFKPAFGRGETLNIDQKEVTVALVKNPSGFTQNLTTFVNDKIDRILIVINDEYADGRDVSWLWDCNIEPLKTFTGTIYVGGTRRFDIALCLKYQGINCEVVDTPEIEKMMKAVIHEAQPEEHLLIIPTYTAMLGVRKWIARQGGGKRIW